MFCVSPGGGVVRLFVTAFGVFRLLVSYKPLAIKVSTSAVDAVRRCCAATRVSTRLRSAAATAEHSYTSLRGRRAPLRHRALEQIYKLTSSRLASLAPSHHQSMPTQGPSPPQGQATGWWPMPFSFETFAWAVSALFQLLTVCAYLLSFLVDGFQRAQGPRRGVCTLCEVEQHCSTASP